MYESVGIDQIMKTMRKYWTKARRITLPIGNSPRGKCSNAFLPASVAYAPQGLHLHRPVHQGHGHSHCVERIETGRALHHPRQSNSCWLGSEPLLSSPGQFPSASNDSDSVCLGSGPETRKKVGRIPVANEGKETFHTSIKSRRQPPKQQNASICGSNHR